MNNEPQVLTSSELGDYTPTIKELEEANELLENFIENAGDLSEVPAVQIYQQPIGFNQTRLTFFASRNGGRVMMTETDDPENERVKQIVAMENEDDADKPFKVNGHFVLNTYEETTLGAKLDWLINQPDNYKLNPIEFKAIAEIESFCGQRKLLAGLP